MNKHRNKIDRLLRVWIATISVLTAASDVQASGLVDSLPELDRRTLSRGIRKPKNAGKLPTNAVSNDDIQRIEQVQHGLEDTNNASDLTWDDNENGTMLYGRDQSDLVSEKRRYVNYIEDWSFDEEDTPLDDLAVNALSYYPEASSISGTLSAIQQICDENDALLANKIPSGKIDTINDEELELNYREVSALQNEEEQEECGHTQNQAYSLEEAVEQTSDSGIGSVPFVISTDVDEPSAVTMVSAVNGIDAAENVELKPASDAIGNNTNSKQADRMNLSDTSRVELASHTINHNATTLASNILKRLEGTGSMIAVSAGDDDMETKTIADHAGFYISPIIGKATQKEDGSISGYHSKSKGLIVGFDTYAQDNMLISISYTKADNHIKFSNNKLGDRSKVTSDFYSVYGQVEPYNKSIFISGMGIYGISNIKSSARRCLDSSAISKHRAYSNIIQVTIGSHYKLSERLKFMPQLGMKYSKIRDAAYEESVAGVGYGLSVSGTKEKVIETVAGFKMNYSHSLSNKVSVAPVVYGFIHKNVTATMPVIRSRLQLATNNEVLPDVSISRARLNFSYGAGFTVKSKNVEIGVFYNGSKTRRYISHSGSMKLKINI